jgi:hypothetical protein
MPDKSGPVLAIYDSRTTRVLAFKGYNEYVIGLTRILPHKAY